MIEDGRTSREWQPAITSLVESELDLAGATTHRSLQMIQTPASRKLASWAIATGGASFVLPLVILLVVLGGFVANVFYLKCVLFVLFAIVAGVCLIQLSSRESRSDHLRWIAAALYFLTVPVVLWTIFDDLTVIAFLSLPEIIAFSLCAVGLGQRLASNKSISEQAGTSNGG